ncbi:hypothetical protein ACFOW1_05405 [Parasediminibacterium paludis]|uniref:Uncharacterized protein n=1 Tax=Parasediminibacterium paludis TaxID=908966 RepID=A0ABV8PWE4_9BACT
MEDMQLNPFDEMPRLTVNTEERFALFVQAKAGDATAMEKLVSIERDMIEKLILIHQQLNTHSKCTFTELYEYAVEELKGCISRMEFDRYEEMITWSISARIKQLLITRNTREETK